VTTWRGGCLAGGNVDRGGRASHVAVWRRGTEKGEGVVVKIRFEESGVNVETVGATGPVGRLAMPGEVEVPLLA